MTFDDLKRIDHSFRISYSQPKFCQRTELSKFSPARIFQGVSNDLKRIQRFAAVDKLKTKHISSVRKNPIDSFDNVTPEKSETFLIRQNEFLIIEILKLAYYKKGDEFVIQDQANFKF